MFHLDKKHLAAALLHPQYRKLTFIDEYKRSKTHIYVQQLLTELYAYGIDQNKKPTATTSEPLKKNIKLLKNNSSILMIFMMGHLAQRHHQLHQNLMN